MSGINSAIILKREVAENNLIQEIFCEYKRHGGRVYFRMPQSH